MKSIFTFLLIIISLLLIENKIYGQKWENLKNIESLYVLIADIDKEAVDLGLSKSRIRTIVELELKRAGIKIIENVFEDAVTIFVYMNTLVGEYNVCFNIDLNIIDLAYLRTSKEFTSVYIWYTSKLTLCSHSNYLESVEKSLNSCLDEFLNEYYKANPK